jgi:hypothetical protein
MRREKEQFQPIGREQNKPAKAIKPVLTGVMALELKALHERVHFSTNEKRAGADYNQ